MWRNLVRLKATACGGRGVWAASAVAAPEDCQRSMIPYGVVGLASRTDVRNNKEEYDTSPSEALEKPFGFAIECKNATVIDSP